MSVYKYIKVHYFDKNEPKVRTFDKALEAFAFEQMGSRRRSQYTDGVPRVKVDSPSP